ncbi:MAG: nucleotidyltransferase domain-containing protein [Verrucomicrobia bacterium]|nr:nucleotidyltransferase domain-containing protein [Verrucomicrobiota bacterium]
MQKKTKFLDQIVDRVVAVARPRFIVLFGSAARNDTNSNSDLDVLVVVRDGTHRGKTCRQIYRGLYGLGCAVDVVVATEQDIRLHRNNPGLVIQNALAEGREIYHAAA